MSKFNVSTMHPLIPNAQQYMLVSKYVSIHSEDRDCIKYPSSSEFEIELPEDYLNVQTVKLSTWTFPANYDVFSASQSNIQMTFQINIPKDMQYTYRDDLTPDMNALFEKVFSILQLNNDNYIMFIEEGFYNPIQMATELGNSMNAAVTRYLYAQLNIFYASSQDNVLSFQYTDFVVVYNSVSQKLWFGNRSVPFTLTNNSELIYKQIIINAECQRKGQLPEFVNWGLPSFIGFTRAPAISKSSDTGEDSRFYYGDVIDRGDNGVWLTPVVPGTPTYFLAAPLKINLMGPSCFYMEIAGMNNIDETMPFAISRTTRHTNITNGIVNSAFAKIVIPATPISQWFDQKMDSYMLYNPPAERIRRLRIKLRYHDNQPVEFGLFDYSFTLQFSSFLPQSETKYSMYIPESR